MNYKLFSLFSTILLFASCSNDSENESNTIVADKELNAITHINYIYGYVDQPATRTYTTNYTLNGNKIDFINKTVFHYFDEDQSRNYTYHSTSDFIYDANNRLVKVEENGYSDYDVNEKHFRTYEFDYYEDDKIKSLLTKDENGDLYSKYSFVYQSNLIEEIYDYYYEGAVLYYNETVHQLDAKQRIYRRTTRGPFFENTYEDSISETTQEAIYNEEGNVYQTFFNESPSTEFEYSAVKIPTELPRINLPHLGYIPYNIILAQFDGMIQSYNTNYINTIIPLEPTNNYIITYKNILSRDNYPLSIKVFYNEKVRSETTYTYE